MARFAVNHAPVRVVDRAIVPPDRLEQMLALIADEMVPVMEDAGARFGSCQTTSPEIGEPVIIETTWLVESHAAWNLIRKACFFDPRWQAMWTRARALRLDSDRRFFYPVSLDARRPDGEG